MNQWPQNMFAQRHFDDKMFAGTQVKPTFNKARERSTASVGASANTAVIATSTNKAYIGARR